MTNLQIVHAWASGQKTEASNTGNSLFFFKENLYSYGYHYVIARKVNTPSGVKILLATRGYSNTTAKHTRLVYKVIAAKDIIFCHNAAKGLEADNVQQFLNEFTQTQNKLQTARKPEIHLKNMLVIARRAKTYCEALSLELPVQLNDFLTLKTQKP